MEVNKNETKVERKSDLEHVVTRTVNAPARPGLPGRGPRQNYSGGGGSRNRMG
jgi:hypothetical protein